MTINGENPINKDGCVDHHFYPDFKGKPIREIAQAVALMEDNMPDATIYVMPESSIVRTNPEFTKHSNKIFYLRQEMQGRCGGEYTQQYIDEARRMLRLLT
jgi:hypothetical protein